MAILGLVFLFLGGTFVIEAAIPSLWLAFAGGAVGWIVTLYVLTRGGVPQRGKVCHADLTCGAISFHRGLEGVAIGMLYSAGAVIGVLGAIAIAGHTALETGAVGSQYSSYRFEAILAIGLVQLSYAGGAVTGVGLILTIPVTVQSASLSLAGGILLAIGTAEIRNADIINHVARRT